MMLPSESIEADLQIFVSEESEGLKSLGFRASASDPALGFGTFVDYGKTQLRVDPVHYLDELFSDLQAGGRGVESRLEEAGVRLFEDLLPFELRRRLWRAHRLINSIFIVSPEAWIPWEIMKLQDPEGDGIGPFFAEAFAVGRWLSSSGPRSGASLRLPLRRLGLIVPADSGLPMARMERRNLLALAGDEREVIEIKADRSVVADAMAEGSFDGLHFCGHGQVADSSIEPWYLQLEAASFEATRLHGRARGLGRQHPLVFLNACHGARVGEALAGVGGLPSSFLHVGAGAFIGPLWQVSDDGAALFAKSFYEAFLGGDSLGEAVRKARSILRQENPDDPTWLAYVLLGHPSAMCRMAESIPAAEQALPEVVARGREAGGASRQSSPRRSRPTAMVLGSLRGKAITTAAVGVSLLAVLLVALWFWQVPTKIRIEGSASSISGRLGADGAWLLGDALTFRNLALPQLSAAELDTTTERAQEIRSPEGLPTLNVSASEGGLGGNLGRLHLAKMQRVMWEAERLPNTLALHVEGVPEVIPYEITLPRPCHLNWAGFAEIGCEKSRALKIYPGTDGLIFEAELPFKKSSEPGYLLLERPFEIAELEFVESRSLDGSLRSAIHMAKLSYPALPEILPIELGRDGAVVLDPRDVFRMTLLELDPQSGDLSFVIEGRARSILAGTAGEMREHRLTALKAGGAELRFGLLALPMILGCVWWRYFIFTS